MTGKGCCRRMTVLRRVSVTPPLQSSVGQNNTLIINKNIRPGSAACLGLVSASRLGFANARKQKKMTFQQDLTPRPVWPALGSTCKFRPRRTGKRRCAPAIAQGLAGALLFCLWPMLAPSSAGASDIRAGQSVYEAHCVSCHGPEGTPTMPGTPDLSRGEGLDVTDLDLARRIKQGKNLMPAYEALIKDDDILNVIAYIRTLRR